MVEEMEPRRRAAGETISWKIKLASGEVREEANCPMGIVVWKSDSYGALVSGSEHDLIKGVAGLLDQLDKHAGITPERIMAYYVIRFRGHLDIEPEQVKEIAELPERGLLEPEPGQLN